MNIFAKIYCRIFQTAFRMALPVLPYREPEIIRSCAEIGKVAKKEKISSVLIVTDKGIVNNGLVDPVEAALQASGVSYCIYADTQPNPTVQNVEDALQVYHVNHCDALIAVGGGSSMDCAKAVGARVAYPKRTVNQLGGKLKVWRKLPTLIAIPTTAGTGSETTLAAMITDSKTHHKYAIMSFPLIPKYAVLDASLTYSLPPHLTSTTGVDALTHAVEAYIGRSTSKETRRLSLEATKLVFENVEAAYKDGNNHTARENMLHAAYKAGIAFSKSYVGYIHAVAHSIGGKYGTPHGLANAVVMPYVLESYGKSVYKKLHRLGIAAGVATEEDAPMTGAIKFINAVKALNTGMNIPEKLSGIQKGDIPSLAKHAAKEANPLYPVPKLMNVRQLEQFYYMVADWS
ncbi:MAG: iron-containing alcohol dehydrogenase [Oscillospiraceae bacterium]|nr:iron-containing alcohol dehydrogenase [Oscillospiraceae bacterium]